MQQKIYPNLRDPVLREIVAMLRSENIANEYAVNMITVTAAVMVENGLVLAARRKPGCHLAGYWEFPGGKLEAGESERECLARELREEFGITCVIGEFIAESIYDYGNKTIRLRVYRVDRCGGTFTCRDHDRVCWLSAKELHTLCWAPADLPILNKVVEMARADSTLAYYRNNAVAYAEETRNNTSQLPLLHEFTRLLPAAGHILDLGCGSGRDSRYFLDQGFRVTPSDASPEMADIARHLFALQVRVQKAEELDDSLVYDGVWACASLVHVPKSLLPDTFSRIIRSLKPGGIWYMSFKRYKTEIKDNTPRFFNNYTTPAMRHLLATYPEIRIIDMRESSSFLRGKQQRWLNVFAAKA